MLLPNLVDRKFVDAAVGEVGRLQRMLKGFGENRGCLGQGIGVAAAAKRRNAVAFNDTRWAREREAC